MYRRALPMLALFAPYAAGAAAPALIPVTGYLTDDAGAPVNDTVTLNLKLYGTATSPVWEEIQDVDVDNGQFTVYLGDANAIDLATFRDNGVLELGIAVDSGAEMSPRFEVATAPFAAYAQYCDDAATVAGIDPGDFRLAADELLWTELQDIPASLLDGDQDTTYTSGTGLALSTARQFSVDQAVIEGWAKGVAYDTLPELRALLDAIYAAKASCTTDQLLKADSGGNWVCVDASSLPISEAAVDAAVANNGYAAATTLTSLTSRVTAAEASVAAAQTSVAAMQTAVTGLGNTPGNMIAQYEFDEGVGATTFIDTSGLGNDLTAASGAVSAGGSIAHATRSVNFTGVQGMIAASGNSIPSTAQVQSELWLRTGDTSQTATLLDKQGAWKLRMVGGRAEWTVTTVGGPCTITHSTPLVNNTWTHISGWANALSATISVNGTAQTVGCTTGPIASAAGSAFTIGGRFNSGSWSEVFNGNLDEVRVRPTAPTQTRESGTVVNVGTFVSNTRRVLPFGSTLTLETLTYNKKSPTSYLLIDGMISGWGNYSGDMTQGWKYGTAPEVIAQGVMYDNTPYTRIYGTKAVISGYTTTGPQTLTFRYYAADGGGGNAPFLTYNPNGSDQSRLAQTQSVYTVWEIEP